MSQRVNIDPKMLQYYFKAGWATVKPECYKGEETENNVENDDLSNTHETYLIFKKQTQN